MSEGPAVLLVRFVLGGEQRGKAGGREKTQGRLWGSGPRRPPLEGQQVCSGLCVLPQLTGGPASPQRPHTYSHMLWHRGSLCIYPNPRPHRNDSPTYASARGRLLTSFSASKQLAVGVAGPEPHPRGGISRWRGPAEASAGVGPKVHDLDQDRVHCSLRGQGCGRGDPNAAPKSIHPSPRWSLARVSPSSTSLLILTGSAFGQFVHSPRECRV